MQELMDVSRFQANGNAVGLDEILVELSKLAINGDSALQQSLSAFGGGERFHNNGKVSLLKGAPQEGG